MQTAVIPGAGHWVAEEAHAECTWATAAGCHAVSPAATARIRRGRESPSSSAFSRKPATPRARASRAAAADNEPVSTMTRTSGCVASNARVASRPDIRGMTRSIRTTSGSVRTAASTTSEPSTHSATTWMSAVPAKMSPSALRTSGWSSAMRTLIMRAPAVSRPPATGCRGCPQAAAPHRLSQPGDGGSIGPPSYGEFQRAEVTLSSPRGGHGRRGHDDADTQCPGGPRRTDRSLLPPPTDPLGRRPVAAPGPPRGGTQCTTDPRPRDAPCSGTDHRLLDLLVDLALDDRARHDEFLDPGDCPVAAPTFASAAPVGDARTPPRTTHAYSLPARAR